MSVREWFNQKHTVTRFEVIIFWMLWASALVNAIQEIT